MPERDGIETLQELLSIDPAVRVITFSGRVGAAVHNETARILGAVASFQKPFVLADVMRAVREALAIDAPGPP